MNSTNLTRGAAWTPAGEPAHSRRVENCATTDEERLQRDSEARKDYLYEDDPPELEIYPFGDDLLFMAPGRDTYVAMSDDGTLTSPTDKGVYHYAAFLWAWSPAVPGLLMALVYLSCPCEKCGWSTSFNAVVTAEGHA